jgi:hypothetical protein
MKNALPRISCDIAVSVDRVEPYRISRVPIRVQFAHDFFLKLLQRQLAYTVEETTRAPHSLKQSWAALHHFGKL